MFTNSLKRVLVGAILVIAATSGYAADKGYKLGSVWNVAMISVEAGQTDEYLKSLKGYYTTVMEQAIKEKLVISYKLFQGARANPQDFNFMILIEAPNWASFDGASDKFDALAAKFAGSEAKADETNKREMSDRAKIRTIFGGKNMQEVIFVK